MRSKTIPETFWNQIRARGEGRVALRCFTGGGDVSDYTWAEYGERVALTALGLLELGLKKGDRVSIIGNNRHEWLESDLAIICAGGITVPIYVTLPPKQIEYILEHSESRMIVVENEALLNTIQEMRGSLPQLEKIIVMDKIEPDDPSVLTLEQVRGRGVSKERQALDEAARGSAPEDVFTIVYTSGTTGFPKGVMLTHTNMLSAIETLMDTVGVAEDGREFNLSFLPLAHIAERMLSCFISAYVGGTTCFGKGLETLPDDLKRARPTVFFAVPRLYEKFFEGIQGKLKDASGLKGRLARWAVCVGQKRVAITQSGQKVPPGIRLRYSLARRLVFSKLKAALGLDRIRVIASGAAPIKKEILEFFHAIDIPVREIYGQTEDCAVTTIHRTGNIKLGNVGQPFPGLQLKIGADGEILIKGGNIFKGYFKDPEATAAAFSDGWFHTGDAGMLDDEGFLTITDRLKDLIITAGGKNIAPQNIENLLKSYEHISNAVVIGDRRPYLVGLLALDEAALIPWAEKNGLRYQNIAELTVHPDVKTMVAQIVCDANSRLGRFETLKQWAILPGDLSIEEGELTPTLKVKRHEISRKYAQLIDSLYQGRADRAGV